MSGSASERYEVDVEPAERSGSFWHKLAFLRLNIVGNLAAEAIAGESGGTAPSLLPGTRIVVRDLRSGTEVWHVNTSDVTGGTSPEQLRDDLQRDLDTLSVSGFVAKWGISE